MIEISDSDAGSSHQLSPGEELCVRLPENPTTGYRWQLTQSGSGRLKLVEDRFEPGGSAVGSAGHRALRFVAEKAGAVALEAVHRREWEQASSNDKKKAFAIVVR